MVGERLGVSARTMSNWAKQDRRDTGEEHSATIDELEELARLRKEVRELRRVNGILTSASVLHRGARPDDSGGRHICCQL